MTVIRLLALLLILTGMFYSCFYKNADIPGPSLSAENCDTANTSYSKTIAPIIDQYCGSCHNSYSYQIDGGGYELEGYNNIKGYAGMNGFLIKSITSSPGAIPMPYEGMPIPDCAIAKIQSWINAGAPNN